MNCHDHYQYYKYENAPHYSIPDMAYNFISFRLTFRKIAGVCI